MPEGTSSRPDEGDPSLAEGIFGLHVSQDMAEALRERADRRGDSPRIGPRPTSIAEQEALKEILKKRQSGPMVDLMDRSIPVSEEAQPEEDDQPAPPEDDTGDGKVVPISSARSEPPSTPPPETDEAPGALQA